MQPHVVAQAVTLHREWAGTWLGSVGGGLTVQLGFCPASCVPWLTAESALRNGHLPKAISFFSCLKTHHVLTSAQVLVECRREDCSSEGSRKYMAVRWLVHEVLER